MIFNGFLFGLGILMAILGVAVVVLLIVGGGFVLRLRSKYVSAQIWEDYLDDLANQEDFEEAAIIGKLLAENRGMEKIKLPKGYGIQITLRTSDNHRFPFAFNRNIIILKNNKVLNEDENEEGDDDLEAVEA